MSASPVCLLSPVDKAANKELTSCKREHTAAAKTITLDSNGKPEAGLGGHAGGSLTWGAASGLGAETCGREGAPHSHPGQL